MLCIQSLTFIRSLRHSLGSKICIFSDTIDKNKEQTPNGSVKYEFHYMELCNTMSNSEELNFIADHFGAFRCIAYHYVSLLIITYHYIALHSICIHTAVAEVKLFRSSGAICRFRRLSNI